MEEHYKPRPANEVERKCQQALESALTPRKVLKSDLENRMKTERDANGKA